MQRAQIKNKVIITESREGSPWLSQILLQRDGNRKMVSREVSGVDQFKDWVTQPRNQSVSQCMIRSFTLLPGYHNVLLGLPAKPLAVCLNYLDALSTIIYQPKLKHLKKWGQTYSL